MLFQEIRLLANGLSELYNFYDEVLGLPTVFNKKNVSIIAGKSKLIFEETVQYKSPFYYFAFNIPSNKFEEAFEWVKEKVELLWLEDYNGYIADFVNWHAKSFYFTDPAGNILEIIARFDLKDSAADKFSGAQIRNISEIGLVFPAGRFQDDTNNF